MIETEHLAARVPASSDSCPVDSEEQAHRREAMERWAAKKRKMLEISRSGSVSEDQLDVRISKQNEYWSVEATAELPSWTLAATHHSNDLPRAIDAVADKLARQMLQLEPSYQNVVSQSGDIPRLKA